jgi:hypothetical protein
VSERRNTTALLMDAVPAVCSSAVVLVCSTGLISSEGFVTSGHERYSADSLSSLGEFPHV